MPKQRKMKWSIFCCTKSSAKNMEDTISKSRASEPIFISNTYFFEKNYDWEGINIDISSTYQSGWETTRPNPLLIQEALQTDYEMLLMAYPHLIDYLSLDIDMETRE